MSNRCPTANHWYTQLAIRQKSIATPPDSDLKDEQLRKMLASPLYFRERVENEGQAQAYHSERESLMIQSSRNPEVSGKLDAVFHATVNRVKTLFPKEVMNRETDSRVVFVLFLDLLTRQMLGNHFLMETRIICSNQAKSELMKQEHQVGSLHSCIDELQQQAYAQRLELEDAHHGYVESRREQLRPQEELSMKETALREIQIRHIHEMGEMKRAQEFSV